MRFPRPFLPHPFRHARSLALAAGFLALAGCGGGKSSGVSDPLVTTPVLALQGVKAQALFYNGPARPWLLLQRPELVPPAERGAEAPRARSMAQAVQSSKLFRQLSRQEHFDTVLLVGDPSEYRPLLDHLLDSPDWKLDYVDHTSVLFVRQRAKAWTPAELSGVRSKLEALPKSAAALGLARLAARLVAVRKMPAAKEVLEAAEKHDGKVPEVWSAQAEYRMALGDWTGAIASADQALKLDEDCLPALGAKAQSLYAKKRFAEAYPYSRKLNEKLPDDPGILFYHAKIAHESRHFTEEIRALERLIDLAGKSGRSDPGYRVYLGQAYAAAGDAEPALAEFAKALADPDLPGEQRQFAEETSALIRTKIGAKP